MKTDLKLMIAAVVVIAGVFSIPFYCQWYFGNIMSPPMSYQKQFEHLGFEDRKVIRYGKSFIAFKRAASILVRANARDPVILLPPTNYIIEAGVQDIEIPEPAMFYYFTGYRSVWANSARAGEANCALVPAKGALMLRPITDKEDLAGLLNLYKKYLPAE